MFVPFGRDLAVLVDVARVIAHFARLGIVDFVDRTHPLHLDDFTVPARALNLYIHRAPMGTDVMEGVLPAFFKSKPMVLVTTDIAPDSRAFVTWHGITHCAAGHKIDLRIPAPSDTMMTHEERVADTTALVRAIPTRQVAHHWDAKRSWDEIRTVLSATIRDVAPWWNAARVTDRAELRLALYRSRGL